MAERKCLACNQVIFGRSDKKFCGDQCRNDYNNQQKDGPSSYMRNINNILRKNRRILRELNPTGKTTTHRDQLNRKGFDFGFYTNQLHTKAGNVYYFCYEEGYLVLENDFFALVRRSEQK